MNKLLKHGVSCILAFCLILTPILNVDAASTVSNGSCGTNLTWNLDSEGVLTINGTGSMNNFINPPWNSYINNIKSVVVNSGVTSIGNQAFVEAVNLTNVSLPNGLSSIGNYAFAGCSSLKSISIGSGLTTVGSSAFSMCSSLESINLPNTVSSIGKQAFLQCKSLTSFTIPSNVTTIGESTFFMCIKLNSIVIPNSVKTITGTYAFSGCTNLKTVSFGTGITNIGESAFFNCKGLTSINIPGNVKTIGKSAFAGCNNINSLTLNEGLVTIGQEAFYAAEFNSVTIPTTVTSIGIDAFAYGGEKILYGNKGSIAENYVKNYNYLTFVIIGSGPISEPEKPEEPKESQIQLVLGQKYVGTVNENTNYLYLVNIPCDCRIYPSKIWRSGSSSVNVEYLNSAKYKVGGFNFSSASYAGTSYGYYAKKGTYYIRISGTNAKFEIVFDLDNITVPTNLKITQMSNNSISVQWNKVENVSGYELTYSYSGINNTMNIKGADVTSSKINNIPEDRSVRIEICSICKIGNVTRKSKSSKYVVGYTAHNAPI